MWKLTIEDDEGSQTSLQLASTEYHIGRDEGNNVRLTDRNVSRRHATLKRNGDETWHLVDHESYNGSFVNGQRVSGSAKLGHADLVQLGDYRIFLTNEERVLAPPSSASGKPASSSVPPPAEYPDRLVVLVGPEPGYECRLDRGVVTIGRSEECTFAINHPSVSRVHAVVHPVAPGRFEILDKDSANGLRINGVDMRRKILEGGDVIEFGDVQMRYFEQGQAPRLGSDISQRLRALSLPPGPASARAGATERPPRRGGGNGRWAALALGALALGGGALALQSRPQPTAPMAAAPAAPAAPDDDGSNAVVERARAASRTEPAEALRLLATLPEGSPRRRAADVNDVAGQAADALLREASKEADPARRQPVLKPLLSNALVDGERRRQANDLLRPVEAVPPPPSSDAAAPRGSAAPKDRPPQRDRVAGDDGGEAGEAPRTASARAREVRDREGARPPARAKEPREDQPVDVSQAADNEAAMRRSLEPRVYGGRATIEEVRMLKAICGHQGDALCKEKAQEALRKLSE